jgi:hypothetical protein
MVTSALTASLTKLQPLAGSRLSIVSPMPWHSTRAAFLCGGSREASTKMLEHVTSAGKARCGAVWLQSLNTRWSAASNGQEADGKRRSQRFDTRRDRSMAPRAF